MSATASLDSAKTIWIRLSQSQVERIVCQLTEQSGMQGVLIEQIGHLRLAVNRVFADLGSNKRIMSRSTLVALRVWTAFSLNGPDRGVQELAVELGMSPSSAHRYVDTFVAIGLLERTAARKYRLPMIEAEPPGADVQQ